MNSAIIYGTPLHFPFFGLTAGDGFVCGLLISSSQPYCWGSSSHVEMGVPQPMVKGAQYLEISAGDYHVCGLRKPLTGRRRNTSLVDCWGYNMTNNYVFDGQVQSISAGSQFNCGLFSQNRSVFCWGDETSSQVINMVPKGMRFQKISAGGYHVCGILEGVNSRAVCWGRSLLDLGEELSISLTPSGEGQGNVELAPNDPMLSVVGGKFHACGIKSYDRGVVCWGYSFKAGTRVPSGIKAFEIGAGNYFTCGVLVEKSHMPVCWGVGFPTSLPLPVSPRMCRSTPCPPGYFESSQNGLCKSPDSHVCMPCSAACSPEMYMRSRCNLKSDILCEYNCSLCSSPECFSNCSSSYSNAASGKRSERFWSLQLPVIIAEIAFAVFFVCIVSITAVLYVRYKLRDCQCSSPARGSKGKKLKGSSSHQKEKSKVRPDMEEFKIRRAQMFPYEELERATGGFKEESIVGKGSFSCVFKGVLKDGTVVAVKRAIVYPNVQKNSKEFHTELDLLSRLNHAHLLNLLGYCEEGGERLLVYEYMAHGSLHQHLHGNKVMKEQMDWVRRVTIAVQAARGIEYLHGYACPPVIHRDIKSSNILIDEEHNARVADFGLSLLGPADSSSPLAELPAGTLGYLDPEYYRLHYLTTKSDVYSFGVLLLEILSGRKAIDMQYEEGNIVQWAVPLIKSGDIASILDPVLKPPSDIDALRRIANVACKSVRMRGKDRPSMDKVTTVLERALA